MRPPSKKQILVLIAVILLFVVIVILLRDRDTGASNADLIVISDMDMPIGCVGVSYARWDGSYESGMGLNADNSMMTRGSRLYFDSVNWPATVTVYADLQGTEVLAELYIEEAPEAGELWQVTLYEGESGLTLSMERGPKEQP